MLTHVDICTALWDSALGHISCNDENDDGDEDSGKGWGGCFYFLPLSFLQYQSAQCDKMVDNGWLQMCCRITSFGFTLVEFPFFPFFTSSYIELQIKQLVEASALMPPNLNN